MKNTLDFGSILKPSRRQALKNKAVKKINSFSKKGREKNYLNSIFSASDEEYFKRRKKK